jgi:hypothetical protein
MSRSLHILASVLTAGFFATVATAQTATPAQRRAPTNAGARATAPAAPRAPQRGVTSSGRLSDSSILAHRDWSYRSNDTYGFRNPGGVGRVAEYYPPGDRFQNEAPRHITAQIGNGGQPDRNEQLQAQQIGIQRYNALQSHIDRYGAPFGYGYGFGMYYGFGFR